MVSFYLFVLLKKKHIVLSKIDLDKLSLQNMIKGPARAAKS